MCELGLEYEVWGMEYNSKVGIYNQEWHYQACMVFNPITIVYYRMLMLNVTLLLNAKPGIQFKTCYSMHDGIYKYM